MKHDAISQHEFQLFQRLIYKLAGISLSDAKKVLLVSRLHKRLQHYGLDSYSAYYYLLSDHRYPEEQQIMVDLLTTNETYFFREPQHFDFLQHAILPERQRNQPFRIWSAACSSGEEVYTLAMLLEDKLGKEDWQVLGSDISTQVLKKAERAHYPLERNGGIPGDYLRRFCLKGVRGQAGTFLISPALRQRVSFCQINLTLPIQTDIGQFDVIFLRNVMIYFDLKTKQQVINNLMPRLREGGYFIIGHSETLNGIDSKLKLVRPTVYRKEAGL